MYVFQVLSNHELQNFKEEYPIAEFENWYFEDELEALEFAKGLNPRKYVIVGYKV